MSELTLHHFGESSASYRVRLALELKALPYASVLVNIRGGEHRQPAYGKTNPQRLVPCLTVAGHEALGQSNAIVEYLEETHPTPALLPRDPHERARARSLVQQIASDVSPFQKTTLQLFLKKRYALTDRDIADWLEFWVHRGLKSVEAFAAQALEKRAYLFGDSPGIVECSVIPQLHNLHKWGISTAALPALLELEKRCAALPAFSAAHPREWR
ncbi:MAG: maleylacetoacetate isomerase [Pseudomonadota bacterium]